MDVLISVEIMLAATCYQTIGQLDKARSLHEEAEKISSTQWPQGHRTVSRGETLDAIPEFAWNTIADQNVYENLL